jgi:hypothetical protein
MASQNWNIKIMRQTQFILFSNSSQLSMMILFAQFFDVFELLSLVHGVQFLEVFEVV